MFLSQKTRKKSFSKDQKITYYLLFLLVLEENKLIWRFKAKFFENFEIFLLLMKKKTKSLTFLDLN